MKKVECIASKVLVESLLKFTSSVNLEKIEKALSELSLAEDQVTEALATLNTGDEWQGGTVPYKWGAVLTDVNDIRVSILKVKRDLESQR